VKTPSPSDLNARRPRHIRRWTPPLSCAGGSPRPPQSSLHRSHFQNCRRDSKQSSPTPKEPNQTTKPPPRFNILSPLLLARSRHCQTSITRKSPAPASVDVPHQEGPATLIQPVANRCKPSHPRLPKMSG
jgi:hypothetical protein